MAAEWMYKKRLPVPSMSVSQAIKTYIDVKENVLSPSTIRAYRSMERDAFHMIGHLELSVLTPATTQKWVNQIAVTNTPKTVRNKFALLAAAYEMHTGEKLSVTLPAKKRPDLYTPSTEDVKKLVNFLKDDPKREPLLIAVMLAAFCSLRRGEICALTSQDIKGSSLVVSKAMVEDSCHSYVIKQPKSYAGYREVAIPSFLMEYLNGKEGRIVELTPCALSNRFRRAVRSCFSGEINFRFHDMRHYYVSFAHAMGVPDAYIRETGGWKTDHVMRRVYMDTLADERKKQSDMLLEKMVSAVC